MTAHNWRAVRARYVDKGIGDPMTAVPSMHGVLDTMEQLGLESAVHGDEAAKTQAEVKGRIDKFYRKLYGPDVTARAINGDGWQPVPAGFSDEEVEASFDAFLSSGTPA